MYLLQENIAKYQPMYTKNILIFSENHISNPYFYLNDTECVYDKAAVFAKKKYCITFV